MIYLERDRVNRVVLRLNDKGFDIGALDFFNIYFVMSISKTVGNITQDNPINRNIILQGQHPSNMYSIFDIEVGSTALNLDGGQYSSKVFMLAYPLDLDQSIIDDELTEITTSNKVIVESPEFVENFKLVYQDLLLVEMNKLKVNSNILNDIYN